MELKRRPLPEQPRQKVVPTERRIPAVMVYPRELDVLHVGPFLLQFQVSLSREPDRYHRVGVAMKNPERGGRGEVIQSLGMDPPTDRNSCREQVGISANQVQCSHPTHR